MELLKLLTATVVSLCFLGLMLYKRVSLWITLNATALLFGFISLNAPDVLVKVFETLTDALVVSVILATFGVMWLSQLYKETGLVGGLSESLSGLVRSPKVVSSAIPAFIGFLPVPGGALMSAPIVDYEADKLGLKPERKAYVNLWFRHTIFPVYPLSQVLIVTAALTGTTITSIILRQIPVVVVMVIVGYLIGFRGTLSAKGERLSARSRLKPNVKGFLRTFSPIAVTIVVAVTLSGLGLIERGFDVLIATAIGLIALAAVSRPSLNAFVKPIKGWGITYEVSLAVYGAFLLKNVVEAAGISGMFRTIVTDRGADVFLLTVIPAALAFITGSPFGGVALSVSILAGTLTFSQRAASLIYMSSFLGYVIAPIHLCFAFTADYFRSQLSKIYRYVIPSFLATLSAAVLIYLTL